MQTKTQASASARALVGAALIGSAMGMTVIAANAAGSLNAQDQNHDARIQDAGLRGPVSAASEAAPAKPRFVRASILPEPPAILPSTPIPYTAFRTPTPTKLDATDQDVECLTRAVYFESRGDSDIG